MKYMGSKRRIVNDILPIMMEKMNDDTTFVDMFCGGCHVIEKVPSTYRRIANDKNNYLITMWSMLVNTKLEFPLKISKETLGARLFLLYPFGIMYLIEFKSISLSTKY